MIIANIAEGFVELPGKITILVYTQGCSLHCPGCFNTSIWPKDSESALHFNAPEEMLNYIKSKFDPGLCGKHPWIVWLGGDPIEQDDLAEYLKYFHENGFNNCVYTGRELTDVSFEVKQNTQILKTGPWQGIPVTEEGTNQKFTAMYYAQSYKAFQSLTLSFIEFTWKDLPKILKRFDYIDDWDPFNMVTAKLSPAEVLMLPLNEEN